MSSSSRWTWVTRWRWPRATPVAADASGRAARLQRRPSPPPASDRLAPAIDHVGDRRRVCRHRLARRRGDPQAEGCLIASFATAAGDRLPTIPALELVELVAALGRRGRVRPLRPQHRRGAVCASSRFTSRLAAAGPPRRAAPSRPWPRSGDSAAGSIGMVTGRRGGIERRGQPVASLPTTSATGPVEIDAVDRAPRRRRRCRSAAARDAPSASSTFTGSSASTIGIPKIAPADDRTTFGANGSTELPQNTTPATPAASALRTSVPAFPGSRTADRDDHETVPTEHLDLRARRWLRRRAPAAVSPCRRSARARPP